MRILTNSLEMAPWQRRQLTTAFRADVTSGVVAGDCGRPLSVFTPEMQDRLQRGESVTQAEVDAAVVPTGVKNPGSGPG